MKPISALNIHLTGIFLALCLCISLLTAIAPEVLALEEVRTIETRPGVSLEFLLSLPEDKVTETALIFMPGGNGSNPFRITREGTIYGWSFLVRTSNDFVKLGYSIAIVDAPSDNSTGLSIGFRESPEHAKDISMLIDYLVAQGAKKVFIVGNSRGTVSATSVGTRIQNKSLKGIILTSSLEYESFMRYLPLSKIKVPVLMVHHREDACRVCNFLEAVKTRDALKQSTTVDLVEVHGGAPPMSSPCNDLSAHGFFGVESKVVPVIADWLSGKKIPSRIE